MGIGILLAVYLRMCCGASCDRARASGCGCCMGEIKMVLAMNVAFLVINLIKILYRPLSVPTPYREGMAHSLQRIVRLLAAHQSPGSD